MAPRAITTTATGGVGNSSVTRRRFAASAPALLGGSFTLSGCSSKPAGEGYDELANQTWRLGALKGFDAAALHASEALCKPAWQRRSPQRLLAGLTAGRGNRQWWTCLAA